MSTDPFERLQSQISGPRKARIKAAQTRAERRQEKEERERDWLFREWREWHDEQKAALLSGQYAVPATELVDFLEHMTLNDADELIELVKCSPLRQAEYGARFQTLRLISRAIIYLCERNGLYPFDDPLPDDEPGAYQIVKRLLGGVIEIVD